VVTDGLFIQAEHQGLSKLESLGRDEIPFASDDETTSANEHTRRRGFRYLRSMHPVNLCQYLCVPGRTVAEFKTSCFINR
jgi:hypothetical protein